MASNKSDDWVDLPPKSKEVPKDDWQDIPAEKKDSSFGDHLKSIIKKYSDQTNPKYEALTDAGFGTIPVIGSYQDKLRSLISGKPEEEVKKRRDALAREYSNYAKVGTVGGIISQLALPTGIPAAASRLGRVAQAALSGAVMGGLTNAKDTNERIENIKSGGLWSGGLSTLGEGVQRLLGGRQNAERLAFKALRPTAADEALVASDKGREVGATLLDNGVLGGILPPSRETMLSRIKDVKNETGKGIGDIITNLDKAVAGKPVISRKEAVASIREGLNLNPQDRNFTANAKDLNQELQRMLESGDLTPSDAQKLKQQLQLRIGNFDKDPSALVREGIPAKVDRSERDYVSKKLETLAKENLPDKGADYLAAKDKYGNLSTAEEVAQATANRDNATSWFNKGTGLPGGIGILGLTRLGLNPAIAGTAAGGLILGKGIANYGTQGLAKFLNTEIDPFSTARATQSIWQQIKKANDWEDVPDLSKYVNKEDKTKPLDANKLVNDKGI